MVRSRTNEPTIPDDSDVLNFLNAGVEQVQGLVGAVRLWGVFPTVAMQTVVPLTSDIQDIISCNFSTGDPTGMGSLVYPMQQLEQASFMDAAAGYPALGFGPPQAYLIFQDYGTGTAGFLSPPYTCPVTTTAGAATDLDIWVATTYVNPAGETTISTPVQCVLTAEQQAQVQPATPSANASGYNVYASTTQGGMFYRQNTDGPLPFVTGSLSNTTPTPFVIPGTLLTATPAPSTNTASYPSGGVMTMQVYPAAMIGQVNVFYRGRPSLWADTTATSGTNLDTLAQEAVILWTCARVLEARSRSGEAAQIFKPQFDEKIVQMKTLMQKRTAPKSGQVRDIRNRAYPSSPWWIG